MTDDFSNACACERNGEVTLPQLLHLQNGDETARKIRDPGSRLKKLLAWKAGRDDVAIVILGNGQKIELRLPSRY